MTKHEFYHSTPNDIRIRIDAYTDHARIESQRMEMLSWMTGIYVAHAIGSTFGKSKYPENPIVKEQESLASIAERNGKTEEELSQELLYATLMVNAANFEIEKSAEESVGDLSN